MSVRIGDTTVGPGEPVYVVAEIGSNHDGSLDQAKRLVQAAADAGADAAKFQLYRADKLYPGVHTPGAVPDRWLPQLKASCHEEGVEFLCSVFCLETLDAYMAVRPAAVKIASPEATNHQLVTAAAATGLPVLVSTGAMTLEDVDDLVLGGPHVLDWRLMPYHSLVLLHCVSAYPASFEHMNLKAIETLIDSYDFVPVGLSDHTLEPSLAPVVAAALGACVIEKHLTLDRNLRGPDHPFALTPAEFKLMVDAVRNVPTIMGDGVKRVQPSEDATDRRVA